MDSSSGSTRASPARLIARRATCAASSSTSRARSLIEMQIGTTIAESTPSFAEPTRPPSGAPNVVIIVLDDVGFAQLGCYGSDIESPAIDGLAETGLRFNRFHVTALCSPTRACVLTGRNHHAVGMGLVPEVPMGFP